MDLKTFCGLYSNGIVLLEGKRNVREEDKIKLMEIGKLLAEKMPLLEVVMPMEVIIFFSRSC